MSKIVMAQSLEGQMPMSRKCFVKPGELFYEHVLIIFEALD